MDKKMIIIFTGPSGAGKTTFAKFITNKYNIPEIVSCTSRTSRVGEVEGIDYYFKTKSSILELINDGQTVDNSNLLKENIYCITKEEIDNKFEQNDVICAVTDIDGLHNLKKHYGSLVKSIFVYTDIDTLTNRLLQRGDNPTDIIKRISGIESNHVLDDYKYCDFSILNKNIEASKYQVSAIIEYLCSKK